MTVILILSLLLVSSPVSAAGIAVTNKTGDGVWDGNTWKVVLYPGEIKSTTIELYNSSSSRLDVEVSVIPDSSDDGNLTFELDKTDFTMSGRSYANVTLTVKASGSTAPSTYTAELKVKSEEEEEDGDGGRRVSKLRLYDLKVENITENSVDITWRTSRLSRSELTYWASDETTIIDKDYTRKHLVRLEDLKDDTTYYFEIACRDKYKLRVEDDGKFTTLEKEIAPTPTPAPTPTLTPSPTPTLTPTPTPTLEPAPTPLLPPSNGEPEVSLGIVFGVSVAMLVGLALIVVGLIYWRSRRRASE